MKLSAQSLITAVKTLLIDGKVSTQEDLRGFLLDQGFAVNQSKISRLLRKIGAIKIIDDRGTSCYTLPRHETPPSAHSSLSQLISNIVANENMIIIHTNPGSASLIGRLLDHQTQELGILGTVAGDDTVLVIPSSIKQVENTLIAVKNRLYRVG